MYLLDTLCGADKKVLLHFYLQGRNQDALFALGMYTFA